MSRVLVAGAGIAGCFTAYFLVRAGIRVTLLERSGVASAASGCNPGGLNPLHGPGIPGPMLPLALHSFRLHLEQAPEVSRLSGLSASIERVSRIEMAFTDSESVELSQTERLYNSCEGFSARWLDRRQLLKEESRCNPEACGGLLLEGNAMIDSPAYTAAVCQAATALGAELRLGPLAGIVRRGTRVTAVRAKSDTIPCDALILATGPYLEDAENWLSTAIPVRPLKGQLLKAAIPPPAFRHHVTWKAAGIYSLPGGAAWLGGTQENAGYDRQPTAEGREAVLDAVSRLVPSLRNEARIISHEAALRPMTPDGLPVLGRVPDWENVYVVSGAGTKGMLLGAGMGECAACIVTDSQPACDVQPFSLDRFNPQPCPVLEASPQS